MEGLIFGGAYLRKEICVSGVGGAYFRDFTVCTMCHIQSRHFCLSQKNMYIHLCLKCLCHKSSIVDRFISTVVTIQYYDNSCRNAMIITSSPHIVHVVSMLDVPSRFGSTSFQSKEVKGAQKSEFLFCVTKRSTKCTHTLKANVRNYSVQRWLLHKKLNKTRYITQICNFVALHLLGCIKINYTLDVV